MIFNSPQLTSKGLKNISIETSTHPTREIKSFLTQTLYGVEGKLRYRHKRVGEKVDIIPALEFLTLKRSGKLLAVAGLISREVECNGSLFQAKYIRYLSFPSSLKKKRKPGNEALQKSKKHPGILKTFIESFLRTPSLLSESAPHICYAFVEKENINSQNLCKALGFKQIRTFKTGIFSRSFPKKSPYVFKALETDIKEIQLKLTQTYHNHNFYFDTHTFLDEDYFIYRKNGKILAGIKTFRSTWAIDFLPGFSGFIIQNIIPHIPILSRIINPSSFTFLAFEAMWFEEGCEGFLIETMEALCALFGVKVGLFWMDSESIIYKKLLKTNKLGLLQRLEKDISADVLVKFNNISEEVKSSFYHNPVYLSAFDMT